MRFRTGRHLGRTVYVQTGNAGEPSRELDHLVGCMDTPELGHITAVALTMYAERSKRNRAQVQEAIRKALEHR